MIEPGTLVRCWDKEGEDDESVTQYYIGPSKHGGHITEPDEPFMPTPWDHVEPLPRELKKES